MTRRRVLTVATTVLLLAIGGAAILLSPRDDDVTAPIEVHGTMGHRIAGRELTVTVSGVHLAHRVDYPTESEHRSTDTSGVWIVIDATVTGGLRQTSAQWSLLRLGGATFSLADDAGNSSLNERSFDPRVPFRGSFVFEISRAALNRAAGAKTGAELVLRDTPNVFPDTRPVVELDLSELTIRSSVAVKNPAVVQQ